MNIEILEVKPEQKQILQRLLELYVYDFTEYMDFDLNEEGLYTYPLDDYFNKSGYYAYFIISKAVFCGFALIKKQLNNDCREYFTVGEYFVLKKYRRLGIGKEVANRLFEQFPGHWLIYQSEKNIPAQTFWKKVISEYTNGNLIEYVVDGKAIQEFDT